MCEDLCRVVGLGVTNLTNILPSLVCPSKGVSKTVTYVSQSINNERLLLRRWQYICRAFYRAVYTCDFAYESAYGSVYDLIPKVSSKFI
jgi:hypothetical protein